MIKSHCKKTKKTKTKCESYPIVIVSLHFKLHHKRKFIPIKNPNKNQRQSSGNTRGTRWHRPHFECSHTHKGNGWKLIRHMTVKSLPLRFFPKMIASCLRNLTGQGRIANWEEREGREVREFTKYLLLFSSLESLKTMDSEWSQTQTLQGKWWDLVAGLFVVVLWVRLRQTQWMCICLSSYIQFKDKVRGSLWLVYFFNLFFTYI